MADLHQPEFGIEVAEQVVILADGRGVLVAQSEVQGQIRSNAPVVLEKSRVQPLGFVSLRIAITDLAECGVAGQEIFEWC